MHWLWIALGAVWFRVLELALVLLDAFLSIVRRPQVAPTTDNASPRPAFRSCSVPKSAEVSGRIATVIEPLDPRGLVELDGVEYPALSFRGQPDVGATVRVVRSGRHSLLVEPF
jgi:membrane protein implicated in regulation of membrane protease activity